MSVFVSVGQYILPVMAVLMLAGGLIGYLKARSMPSLASGGVSSILLATCFAASFSSLKESLIGALVIMLVLEVVFAIRLSKTKKFMPSGMLLILTGLSIVVLLLGILSLLGILP